MTSFFNINSAATGDVTATVHVACEGVGTITVEDVSVQDLRRAARDLTETADYIERTA